MLGFESSAVPVAPEEGEETNPGIYGRELASKSANSSTVSSMQGASSQRMTVCSKHAALFVELPVSRGILDLRGWVGAIRVDTRIRDPKW
jgi:hypothetical protein